MPPLEVYEGDRPYIFVSYAHADEGAVMPLIEALVDEGYRVWWDEGIQETEDFPDYIARHVFGCACFVTVVSSSALDSVWCVNEAKYAFNHKKRILPIYLEEVELPGGLELCIGMMQSMYWHRFDTDKAFYRKLFKAKILNQCLTEEGKRRRGVKPRPGGNGAAGFRATEPLSDEPHTAGSDVTGPQAGGLGRVDGVEPKGGLADYSWVKLKELSRAIASVGSDAEGLAIAKEYNLVDEGGRLRGDTKAITLRDGRKTTARIRILGFRHDNLAGGGKAGISFEFADVPSTHCMNPKPTNRGGWEASEMRRWLNDGRGGFLSLLPDDLRPLVEMSAKRTNNRGEVPWGDTTSVTETPDRLWLLSMSEVYGGVPSWMYSRATYAAEGTQYRLYAGNGVTAENYGFCQKRGADGANSWWWLRSPIACVAYRFHGVHDDGDWHWHDLAANGWGASPGFCF